MLNAGNNFDFLSPLIIVDAPAIMKMLAASGIEVIGVGPFEVGLGQEQGDEFLQKLATHTPINLVLANGPGFLPYVRFNKDGCRVLVTSVIDPQILKKYRLKYEVSDPVAALRRILRSIRHDLAIVVIHAGKKRIREIARQCRGIDLVVDGESMGVGTNFNKKKEKAVAVPIVYNNKRGQMVCYIDLKKKNGPAARAQFSRPVAIKALVKKVKPDPGIEKMIAAYNQARAEFFERRKRERFHRYMRNNPPNMFLGDRGCVSCHGEVWRQWKETRHARAVESLKKRRREKDGECLKCHTTGSGFENTVGGFESLEATPGMAGVQCEACHGPGARHAQRPAVEKMKKVEVKRCTRCHDYNNDPEFSFEKRWPKISH